MESKFRGFDTQNQYNYAMPTSSSSYSLNYTYFSDQPMIHGVWSGRSVIPVEIQGGVGFPAPMIVRQPLLTYHQFQPEMMLHGEPFLPNNISVSMPVQARYGGGGYHHRDTGDFEAAPFRRLPPSPPMIKEVIRLQPKNVKMETLVLGKPTGATVSGSKRKAPSPSSSAFCSNDSKKIIEKWRCAVCDISATSERSLVEHKAGKKHLAKLESLKCNKTGGDIGLGIDNNIANKQTFEVKCLKPNSNGGDIGLGIINYNSVKKQKLEVKSGSVNLKRVKMSGGGKMRKNFQFWCKLCKIGANDEKVMSKHKKGKKHLKNRRMKARAKRISGRKSM